MRASVLDLFIFYLKSINTFTTLLQMEVLMVDDVRSKALENSIFSIVSAICVFYYVFYE